MLIQELQQQGLQVSNDAKFEIQGIYRVTQKDDDPALTALRLLAQLLDKTGDTVGKLDKEIDDPVVLAQVFGITRHDPAPGIPGPDG
jgi:hypothetical protein